MQKNSFISVRVSKETKDQAEKTLNAFGYTLSSYINVMLKEVAQNGYPQLEVMRALAKEKKAQSLLTFEEIKTLVSSLAAQEEKVAKVYLFGSYSRGEATPKSDVDLHVISDQGMSLTELIDFENRLAKALGKKSMLLGEPRKGQKRNLPKRLRERRYLFMKDSPEKDLFLAQQILRRNKKPSKSWAIFRSNQTPGFVLAGASEATALFVSAAAISSACRFSRSAEILA